jgi:hypothetical protein
LQKEILMMTRKRWLFVGAAVLMIAGCASGSGTLSAPPSVNLTGKWSGSWQFTPVSAGSGQVIMDLTQTGSDVNGSVLVTGPAVNQPTTVQGTVSGNEFRLAGRISGTFVVTGDQMTGNVNGMLPATATLTRQK